MKILLVNNQFQLGGAETVVGQLHAGITAAGHRAAICVADGKTYPRGVEPLYPKLLSRLSHSRFHENMERFFPRFAWTDAAFRQLEKSDADVIHLHNFHGNYASIQSLAHLATRKKVVWTFHAFWGITGGCDHPRECMRYQQKCGACPQVGMWPVGATDHTAEQLKKKLALLKDAPLHIIAPSRFVAETVCTSQVGQRWIVHHIPNGVAAERFGFARKNDPAFREVLGLDPDATIILVVNRNFQDEQKGFSMIRGALAEIEPRGVQVVLAGENSEWAAAQIPAFATRSIGYISGRAQLAELYEAADVFLFASPAENFPCVVLEAMAAQCCVVATPTGGIVEQITHEKTGLFASAISGESLAKPLQAALHDAPSRQRMALAARAEVVEKFGERQMILEHLKLYSALADEN